MECLIFYIIALQLMEMLLANYHYLSELPEEGFSNFYTYKKLRLIHTSFKTETHKDYLDCNRYCEKNSKCQSINIVEDNAGEGYKCYYLSYTSGKFKEEDTYMHVTKNKVPTYIT